MHPWSEWLRDRLSGVVRVSETPDHKEIAEEMSALSEGYEAAELDDGEDHS